MKYKTGLETRQKIIDTAYNLFAQYGYECTSIDDIMEKIGRTKGTFYAHFKTKDEVFLCVVDLRLDTIYQEVSSLFQKQVESNTFNFLTFLNQFLDEIYCAPARTLWSSLYLEILFHAQKNEEIYRRVQKVYENWRKLLEKGIVEAQKQGQISHTLEPSILARMIHAIYEGYENQYYINPNIDLLEQKKLYQWMFEKVE